MDVNSLTGGVYTTTCMGYEAEVVITSDVKPTELFYNKPLSIIRQNSHMGNSCINYIQYAYVTIDETRHNIRKNADYTRAKQFTGRKADH